MAGSEAASSAWRAVAGGVTSGSSIRNVVPPPGPIATEMLPPCSSMMPRQSDSPRPVPSPGAFVVKNGSKILPWISGGMPGPVSATASWNRAPDGSSPVVISIRRRVDWRRIA